MEHYVKPKKKNTNAVLTEIAVANWTTVNREVNELRLNMIRHSVREVTPVFSTAPIKTGINLTPLEAEYLGVKPNTMYQINLLGTRKICTPFFFEK